MTNFTIVGPVGIRRHHLEKVCNESVGHTHNYDHTTIVINGRLRVSASVCGDDGVWRDIPPVEYSQGDAIFIKANVRHTLKALEPNTAYY